MFSKVLITGATGMIGGEIALQLANLGIKEIRCLVKGFDPQTRLMTRLRKSRLFKDGVSDQCIKAEPGDLRLDDLGVDGEHLHDIDLIIHSAAETSFLKKESCTEINVNGTKRVIALAQKLKNKPLLCYISTACNVGAVVDTCLKEDEGCRPDAVHHNDYTRSKAIGETLIRQSGLPYLIIRPSIILSDSVADRVFARQIFWFVPLLWRFGAVPINAQAKEDAIPVSFFVEALGKLLMTNRSYDCYNISNGKSSCSYGEWVEIAKPILGHSTCPLFIKPENWGQLEQKQYVVTSEQKQIFNSFRHYLPFWNMNVTFDNERLFADVPDLKIPEPADYLKLILDQITTEEAVRESLTP
jgi:nucleoside-diphosphate-sugar epimerase